MFMWLDIVCHVKKKRIISGILEYKLVFNFIYDKADSNPKNTVDQTNINIPHA